MDKSSNEEFIYQKTTLEKSEIKSTFLYISALSANLIALASGMAITWSSPVIPKITQSAPLEHNPLPEPTTSSQESWIASLLSLGCVFGPVLIGRLSDKYGRRSALIGLAVPMAVAYVIKAYAYTVNAYYLSRFILGVGMGGVFTVLPIYLAEIATDDNRGTIGCLFGASIAFGILLTYLIGPFVSVKLFSLICSAPLILFIILFVLIVPESPHFYASTNDERALKRSLKKLRAAPDEVVQKEARDIKRLIDSVEQKSLSNILKDHVFQRGLLVSVGLIALQQLVGINAISCYMHSIFEATGSGLSVDVSAILIGVIQFVTTLLTSVLVDRLGRRILLIASSLFCALSLVGLIIFFHIKDLGLDVKPFGWLPVSSLIVYIIAFNIGLGPLPWAVMAEIFPVNVKTLASTITSSVNFFLSFLIALLFPYSVELFGMVETFTIFAIISWFGVLFIYSIVPETKGKTIEEILKLLENHK